jgi:protein O-GlcNAc transferase
MNVELNHLLLEAKKLHQGGKLASAKNLYLKALKIEPNNADTLHLLGLLYKDLNQYPSAIEYLNRARALKPQMAQVHYNLGLAYREHGDLEKAIECYIEAIRLNPNYPKAHHSLANVYHILGQAEFAFNHYQKALDLKPDFNEALLDCGKFCMGIKNFELAEQCFDGALKLKPDSAEIHFNLGSLAKEKKEFTEAIASMQKALQLNPAHPEYFARLMSLYDEVCDWNNFKIRQKTFIELHHKAITAGHRSPLSPFSALSYNWKPEEILTLANSHAESIKKSMEKLREKLNFKFERDKKLRLRIGYLSSDIRNHPVAHLTNNLFRTHDRNQFEVFVLSHGENDNSVYRKHVEATVEHFIDLHDQTNEDMAKKIHDLGIDILIELNGYTANDKLAVTALRPAPIQLSYIGYLGSIGGDFMDYVLVDDVVAPPGSAAVYSEKLVYLPNCYQVNDDQQVISDKPLARKDYQLPEDAFVLCCFNNSYKIEPQIFNIFSEILTNAPKSVLWFYRTSPLAEQNLRHEAAQRGIAQERIIFTVYEEKPIYLARYRLADIFLDTFVYNANTTGSDALWAGLPLLTCPGNYYPNRGAASMLTALDLPELIAKNPADYRDKVLHFYHHRDELQKIRDKIQQRRLTHPLFDTKRFVRNLEKAYLKMWEIYENGQLPQEFHIKEEEAVTL